MRAFVLAGDPNNQSIDGPNVEIVPIGTDVRPRSTSAIGNTALSEHEVQTEVDRYISWPGQALSYKLGEMKILELRTKAEKELGTKFDLKAFHDAVLANGYHSSSGNFRGIVNQTLIKE